MTNTGKKSSTTSENPTLSDQKISSKIAWAIEKLVLPIILAVITTAAYSEHILNFFSLRMEKPNWLGATGQPKDSTGDQSIFFDEWVLDAKDGRVNAKIIKRERSDDSFWISQGYKSHGTMVISYQSNSSENSGIGAFYLQQVSNTHEYRGRQVNFDCDMNKVLVCPYILAPKQSAELIFNQPSAKAFLAQKCEELPQTPGRGFECPAKK